MIANTVDSDQSQMCSVLSESAVFAYNHFTSFQVRIG